MQIYYIGIKAKSKPLNKIKMRENSKQQIKKIKSAKFEIRNQMFKYKFFSILLLNFFSAFFCTLAKGFFSFMLLCQISQVLSLKPCTFKMYPYSLTPFRKKLESASYFQLTFYSRSSFERFTNIYYINLIY